MCCSMYMRAAAAYGYTANMLPPWRRCQMRAAAMKSAGPASAQPEIPSSPL